MKITILTLGTRGDVQPYAVLGKALAKRGHDVTLSTAKNFKELVESYQLNFHPIDADYEQILNSEEGKKMLKGNPFAIQRNFTKLISPIIEQSLNEFYSLAQASDLTIYRPKTLANVFTNQLSKLAIKAAVVPATMETTAFANPSMSGFRIPEFLYKLSYKINDLKFKILSKPIKQFHIQNGLDKEFPVNSDELCLYGISAHFLERPNDWPVNHHLTGFWFSDHFQPVPEDTEQFINDGAPPILVTFGSMPLPKNLSNLIIEAAQKLNQRFLIVKGWGDLDIVELSNSENIKIINPMPFETLFSKVKAIVHHGGIGTVAECLRAGKPMFICPAVYPLGDQYFWGDLAYKKGVGVKPVPLSQLGPNIFMKRIKELVSNDALYHNSRKMSALIQEENGLEMAVELIETISDNHEPLVHLNTEKLTQIAS